MTRFQVIPSGTRWLITDRETGAHLTVWDNYYEANREAKRLEQKHNPSGYKARRLV